MTSLATADEFAQAIERERNESDGVSRDAKCIRWRRVRTAGWRDASMMDKVSGQLTDARLSRRNRTRLPNVAKENMDSGIRGQTLAGSSSSCELAVGGVDKVVGCPSPLRTSLEDSLEDHGSRTRNNEHSLGVGCDCAHGQRTAEELDNVRDNYCRPCDKFATNDMTPQYMYLSLQHQQQRQKRLLQQPQQQEQQQQQQRHSTIDCCYTFAANDDWISGSYSMLLKLPVEETEAITTKAINRKFVRTNLAGLRHVPSQLVLPKPQTSLGKASITRWRLSSILTTSRNNSISETTSFWRLMLHTLLLVVILMGGASAGSWSSSVFVISNFTTSELQTFRDLSRPASDVWFHYMNVDPHDNTRLYVGSVDILYVLNASNIASGYSKSTNLSQAFTSSTNFTSMYNIFVDNCYSLTSLPNPAYQCRNHVRIVQPIGNNQLFICSTAAYSPQEFYLSAATLAVLNIGYQANSMEGGGSGLLSCPYDPDTPNKAVYVEQGNPLNASALYTATLVYPSSRYGVYRPALSQSPQGSPQGSPQLWTTAEYNTPLADMNYVATFDIGQYVYVFFKEVAAEFSNYDRIFVSRVGRICKSDAYTNVNPNNNVFLSYVKTRINCSISGAGYATTFYFNELTDVWYDQTNQFFYGLFLTNGNSWGTAVCVFALANITAQFDYGQFYLYTQATNIWSIEQPTNVPLQRPSSCAYTTTMPLYVQTFTQSHNMMYGAVNQTTATPPYYTKYSSYDQMTIDMQQNYPVLYLYSLNNPDQITRMVLWSTTGGAAPNVWTFGGTGSYRIISVLTPFNGDTSPMWQMLLHSVQWTTWLYMVKDSTITQISVSLCAHYTTCTSCVVDPYCGWNKATMQCLSYSSGLLQSVTTTSPLQTCAQSCQIRASSPPSTSPVIPLTAVRISCTSFCLPDDGATVTWTWNGQPLLSPTYVLQPDNSLIIMNVTRPNTGTYQCSSNGVVLAQAAVVLSACSYGDDIRDTFIVEYMSWCSTFDAYQYDYNQWLCMKKACLTAGSQCIPYVNSACGTP